MSTDTMTPETALSASESVSDAVSGYPKRTMRHRVTETPLSDQERAVVEHLTAAQTAIHEHRADMSEAVDRRAEGIQTLYAMGWSMRRIADLLGVTVPIVQRTVNPETPKDQETRP